MNTHERACSVSLLFLVLSFMPRTVLPATESDQPPFLDEHTYTILTAVHENMDKEDYASALEKLDKLLSGETIKPYDMAIVQQTRGYVLNTLGKHREAVQAFISALGENSLPEEVTHHLHYLTAQLLIYTESYKEGLQYLDEWFRNEPDPDAEAHMLAASACYQTGNFSEMIPHVETAIGKTGQPQQGWYEILLAGYYETSAFEQAAGLLETMIKRYPDKGDYWLQLTGAYQRLKQEKRALAVSELAHAKGILNNDDILQLARNYLYMQMPYRAARLLQDELEKGNMEKTKETLELLANSWLLARETGNALITLSEVAEKSNDANIYFRLGQLSIEMERWTQAVLSLKSAFKAGLINNVEEAYLLLGIAAFHINDRLLSIKAFNIAMASSEVGEKAKWWWGYLYRSDNS
ncbi:MAG: hypothetical protein A2W28_05820 [Gammaproteobacteria bacterium RBG_16_51_14]|nr:MAG: hypothetical protein A2W28_05820 [Gammaproteobacteria bacterium RBG_16_51_14]